MALALQHTYKWTVSHILKHDNQIAYEKKIKKIISSRQLEESFSPSFPLLPMTYENINTLIIDY